MAGPQVRDLVERTYVALAAGDRDSLGALLASAFTGQFAEGMPLGIGGVHRGADAAARDGWWAIGRAFAVRAEPEEWFPVGEHQVLVLGTYRGTARSTGRPFDAAFAHLWSEADGQLQEVRQYTDTARWVAALATGERTSE